MRYQVKRDLSNGVVDVHLQEDGEEVQIIVGEWCIGVITKKGTLRLEDSIPEDNEEGIQTTEAEEIKVE